jgi:hypothetical protein
MAPPTDYARTATFNGNVSAFAVKLDPRRWKVNAPEIWRHSYLIETPAGAASVTRGPASSLAKSGLDPDRSVDPTPDPNGAALSAWGPPGDGLFFEDVLVAGFRYRNVLRTNYANNASDPAAPFVLFQYAQYDCLDTESANRADGGIDVDVGFSECRPDRTNPARVKVRIAKQVRFTQPRHCVGELNALASVLVPLTFDSWLHDLVFS